MFAKRERKKTIHQNNKNWNNRENHNTTFIVLSQEDYIGGFAGYKLCDKNMNQVGIIWSHKGEGTQSHNQAEFRFNDDYKVEYNVWHRVTINGQRFMFKDLEKRLEGKDYIILEVDD